MRCFCKYKIQEKKHNSDHGLDLKFLLIAVNLQYSKAGVCRDIFNVFWSNVAETFKNGYLSLRIKPVPQICEGDD